MISGKNTVSISDGSPLTLLGIFSMNANPFVYKTEKKSYDIFLARNLLPIFVIQYNLDIVNFLVSSALFTKSRLFTISTFTVSRLYCTKDICIDGERAGLFCIMLALMDSVVSLAKTSFLHLNKMGHEERDCFRFSLLFMEIIGCYLLAGRLGRHGSRMEQSSVFAT